MSQEDFIRQFPSHYRDTILYLLRGIDRLIDEIMQKGRHQGIEKIFNDRLPSFIILTIPISMAIMDSWNRIKITQYDLQSYSRVVTAIQRNPILQDERKNMLIQITKSLYIYEFTVTNRLLPEMEKSASIAEKVDEGMMKSAFATEFALLCILSRTEKKDYDQMTESLIEIALKYSKILDEITILLNTMVGNQKKTVDIHPNYIAYTRDRKPIGEGVGFLFENGFEFSLSKMEEEKVYSFAFDGSRYEAKKNKQGELELFEVMQKK